MPHVLILGGTGPAGLLLVTAFLAKYPTNGTAVLYARNPSKFPPEFAENKALTIVKGELNDETALGKAFEVAHVDAVLSALGPVFGTPFFSFADFYRSFIPLMRTHNSKRLIALSTPSHTETAHDHFSLLAYLLVLSVRLFANAIYKDVGAFTRTIAEVAPANDVEYTVIRVPFLTNAKGKTPVAGYVGDGKVGLVLSRDAYAQFAVDQIESREWVDKVPALSSK